MEKVKSYLVLLFLFISPGSSFLGYLDTTSRSLLSAEFDFALSILNALPANKSCIVSPFSISVALSLVHSGAKGTSRKQIEQVLLNGAENHEFSQHFSNIIGSISQTENGVDFQLANRAFVRNEFTLLDSYLWSIRVNYNAYAVSLDFNDGVGSAATVNSFVSYVTHGKINQIICPNDFKGHKAGVPTSPALVDAHIDDKGWIVSWQEPMRDGGSPITRYAVEMRQNRTAKWVARHIEVRSLRGWNLRWRPAKSIKDQPDWEFRVRAANKEGFGPYATSTGGVDGRISLSDESHSSNLLLVNAVYMNGEWAYPFNKENTFTETFHASTTVTREVEYLSHWAVHRDYFETDLYQLLSLPYKDDRYRFNVFLPKNKFGLLHMQQRITATEIVEALEGRLENKLVNVQLPKFNLESNFQLADILKTLGVKGIFDPSPDLSGFAETDNLSVSNVIHKATLEVDEEGTIAAAVTMVGMAFMMSPRMEVTIEPINFKADHPFLFCITFNSHPVFIGKYY